MQLQKIEYGTIGEIWHIHSIYIRTTNRLNFKSRRLNIVLSGTGGNINDLGRMAEVGCWWGVGQWMHRRSPRCLWFGSLFLVV